VKIEELIDLYGDDLLRLCLLYLGDRQLAEDAFQETMVKAWRQLASFRGESSVKTWLSSIAVNTCRSMLRTPWLRMWRRTRDIDALLNLPAPQHGEFGVVTQAVLALPPKYREVIVLHYYQEWKLREIAEMTGLSVNSVSTRLRRARALLEKTLKEEMDA